MVAVFRSLGLVSFAAMLAVPSRAETATSARLGTGPVGSSHGDMPHAEPASVGMSAERLAVIDRVVANAIAADGFPGGAVIVGRHGAIVFERGYGTLGPHSLATVDPERTLYDLASLTKVVATSAAAMVLVDQRRLRLDDAVGRYLPEFRDGLKSQVTIRQLLTHTSGLPVGLELSGRTPAESRR